MRRSGVRFISPAPKKQGLARFTVRKSFVLCGSCAHCVSPQLRRPRRLLQDLFRDLNLHSVPIHPGIVFVRVKAVGREPCQRLSQPMRLRITAATEIPLNANVDAEMDGPPGSRRLPRGEYPSGCRDEGATPVCRTLVPHARSQRICSVLCNPINRLHLCIVQDSPLQRPWHLRSRTHDGRRRVVRGVHTAMLHDHGSEIVTR